MQVEFHGWEDLYYFVEISRKGQILQQIICADINARKVHFEGHLSQNAASFNLFVHDIINLL